MKAATLLLSLGFAATVFAQESPSSDEDPDRRRGIPDWVHEHPFETVTESEDDPLGQNPADQLDGVTPTRPEEEVEERIPVRRGEVLSAIAGVRENDHRLAVTLTHGLALVERRLEFRSAARVPAELEYRLAVTPGTRVVELEVCNAAGCRGGVLDRSPGVLSPYDEAVRGRSASGSPLPVAEVTPDGDALRLRAAPVRPDEALTVRLVTVQDAPLRGSRVRFVLPARGTDERAAPARISVGSPLLERGSVDGIDAVEQLVERAPWAPAEITARSVGGPPVTVQAHRVRCGRARCARVRVVGGDRVGARPAELIVLLDASPSTQGPARGRLATAAAALLASLPSGARVRMAAFAARAEALVERPTAPADVPLVRIASALDRPLGSATRFESAWRVVRPWVNPDRPPHLVILGDGGLTVGRRAEAALADARSLGVRISAVDVGDRGASAGLRELLGDHHVVSAGAEAARAARGRGLDPLRERLNAVLAPRLGDVEVQVGRQRIRLGPLRGGEERVWEGRLSGAARVRVGRATFRVAEAPDAVRSALAMRATEEPPGMLAVDASLGSGSRVCRLRGPVATAGGAVPATERIALAEVRRCNPPEEPEVAEAEAAATTLVPEDTLLDMLRQRVVPVARGCFRSDRRGRANYQTRALFEFDLADREVEQAVVTGRITDELRECLLRAVETLDVPRFAGRVRVRFPLVTQRELPPPTLELDDEVAAAVDAVTEDDD